MGIEVNGKVAIVTGGATGIGLSLVKQLLSNGIKGVVVADVNSENGEKVCKELKDEFGVDRVVFVQTDIADSTSFENAFKTTLHHFNNIDILINNAGICRDDLWEKEIDVNMKGTTNGMILGLEKYLRNHKQGNEAVILNIASLAIAIQTPMMPIYAATKYGIAGLTKSFGDPCHFERTKVRVVAVCPGLTNTNILQDMSQHLLTAEYTQMLESILSELSPDMQRPDSLAKESMAILEKAPNGTIWIVEESQPPYEYRMTDKTDCKSNILK